MDIEDTIFSVWIQGDLDDISIFCIKSWINLGYKVIMYSYSQCLLENDTWKFKHEKLSYRNANNIFNIHSKELEGKEIIKTMGFTAISDMFRLQRIYQHGGTYLDTDLYLLKRLPRGQQIIGSEYTNQSGAYKSQRLENANFNVLRLYKHSPIAKETMDKIIKCKSYRQPETMNSNCNSFMKIFQKLIYTEKYDLLRKEALAKPIDYSPIAWCYWKDIYTSPTLSFEKRKYDIHQKDFDYILDNSLGIHLWRNLYKKNKCTEIHPNILDKLRVISDNRKKRNNLIFCIPTYKRQDLIKSPKGTLAFLHRHNIPKENIFIFVNDNKEFDNYTKVLDNRYNFVVTGRKGIGSTRSYILNNYFIGSKDIIMIDDDIADIKEGVDEKTVKSLDNLKDFCFNFFEEMKEHKCYFGGIPLYDNPFFLNKSVSLNLKYISGAIQFHRKLTYRTPIELTIDNEYINHFEDYLCDIKYFLRDGRIFRKNNYFPVTKNYNKIGGICEMEGSIDLRMEKGGMNAKRIIELFPNTCSIVKKKGGLLNLRLNHHYKNNFI